MPVQTRQNKNWHNTLDFHLKKLYTTIVQPKHMKKFLLPLAFVCSAFCMPVQAQQVYYSVCKVVTRLPGYYDAYGNYYVGGTQESTIPCNQPYVGYYPQNPGYSYYGNRPVCLLICIF